MKIEEMADVFLNSANFASHALLTLAPPSSYALNIKALIKVSKLAKLSCEILRSSLEKKKLRRQISFLRKEHLPKAQVF